jgi:hypothetical protein
LDGCKYLQICPFLQDFQIIGSQSNLRWFPEFPGCLLLSPLLHFWCCWLGFFLSSFLSGFPGVWQSYFFQRSRLVFHWFFVFFSFYIINVNPLFLLFLSFCLFWDLVFLLFPGVWDTALGLWFQIFLAF